MTAFIRGIGTALPAHAIAQPAAARIAAAICAPSAGTARLIPTLYRRTSVLRRSSVLLENGLPEGGVSQSFFPAASSDQDRGPGTAVRSDRYAAEAPALALRAAAAALDDANAEPASMTHLITVSCTGFAAPGIDAALITQLGLAPTTQRTHIGFMGCHGAINGLRVAQAFASAEPGARVLLCAVELCSLHFHYTHDPEKMVANALFADGAAAAVISGAREPPAPSIVACGSCLIPDSLDAMTWSIGDHGFEMTLSARVPSILEEHLAPFIRGWLAQRGLAVSDIGAWAIHPGGPRVLSTVAGCLGLSEKAMEPSRTILAEHGNMSSPTVLFIVDRLRTLPRPWVAMAFGPGLVAEVALID